MAATRMFLKTNSKLPFQVLRNPTWAAPQLTKPINEVLNQKSPQTVSQFPPSEVLGTSQKLFIEEADFVKVRAQVAVTGDGPRIEVRGSYKQGNDDEGNEEFGEDSDGAVGELDGDFDDYYDEESESEYHYPEDEDIKQAKREAGIYDRKRGFGSFGRCD